MGVVAGTVEELQALDEAAQHRARAGVHEARASEDDSDARRAQSRSGSSRAVPIRKECGRVWSRRTRTPSRPCPPDSP